MSDSGAAGTRADLSGPVIQEVVKKAGYPVVHTGYLLPMSAGADLAAELSRIADEDAADLILTTGGTGFPPGLDPRGHPGT